MKFNIANFNELFSMGIYGIVDTNKKVIYIGKTERCFLFRIEEHIKKIDKIKNKERIDLILGDNSEFIIIKRINKNKSAKTFLIDERIYMDIYINKGFNVISSHSYKIVNRNKYRSTSNAINFNEKFIKRFIKLFDDMMIIFSLKSRISINRCYARAYQLINNKFNNNKYKKENLSIEELKYICNQIYFKYLDILIEFKKNKIKNLM
ncbi:hypothetical protein FDB37_15770 [Clostridium botulinum]|nr:hypothetical protein [Clostridium botulinum]